MSATSAAASRHYWHAGMFITRLGLAALLLIYVQLSHGVAAGGLSFDAARLLILAYAALVAAHWWWCGNRALSMAACRRQIALDVGAMLVRLPHDPGLAMPALIMLALQPLDFGLRYAPRQYFEALAACSLALPVVLLLRQQFFSPELASETLGTVLFTAAVAAHGLFTFSAQWRRDRAFAHEREASRAKLTRVAHAGEATRDELAYLRERHEQSMQAAGVGGWVWYLDEDRFEIDDILDDVFGMAPGDYDGTLEMFLSFVHPDDREATVDKILAARAAGEGFDVRYRRKLATGEVYHTATRGAVSARDSNGQPLRMAGATWDVDAETRAQAAARRLAAGAQAAATPGSGVGFWEYDLANQRMDIDLGWRRLIGLPDTGPLPTNLLLQQTHPQDRDIWLDAIRRCLDSGAAVQARFRGYTVHGGELLYMRIVASPLAASGSDSGVVAGLILDETELIRAQRATERALARVDEAAAGGLGFWHLDAETRAVEFDDNLMVLLGLPADGERPTLDQAINMVAADDHAEFRSVFDAFLAHGAPLEHTYRVIRHNDGRAIHVRIQGAARRNANGEIIRYVGHIQDHTEELTLRHSLQRLQALHEQSMQAAGVGNFQVYLDTGQVEIDAILAELHGIKPEDFDGRLDTFLAMTHPEDRPTTDAEFARIVSTGESRHARFRRTRPDGQTRWMEVRAAPIEHAGGRPSIIAGAVWDVDDETRARAEIRRLSELLLTALDAVTATAFVIDPAANRCDFTGDAPGMLGVAPDTPMTDLADMMTYVDARDRDAVARAMQTAIDEQTSIDITYRVPHLHGGEPRWFRMAGRAERDPESQTRALIGIISDDTAAVNQRTELDALRQQYDDAMNAANIGHFTADLRSGAVHVDHILARLLDVDTQTFAGTIDALINITAPEDRPRITEAITRGIATGETQEFTHRRLAEHGVRWLTTRGSVVFDESGKPLRISAATWDTTALADANAALARSNRDLQDFAYITSHDLREPLRGIHNYARFLDKDYGAILDDEGRHMLAGLSRLAQRLDALIADLLAISRLSRAELQLEPTDLNAVVDNVCATLEFFLQERNAVVQLPRPLPTVNCDRVRVGELLRNLITNAAKYNDNTDKRIEIGRDKHGFYVRDNGIGVPAEHAERVFSIFKRLHARDAYGGGTGAGLAIARQIVERHGGRIWLESTPGKGSTFRFTLGTH